MENTNIPNEELEIYNRLSKNFNIVFDVGSRDDIDYYNINPLCQYHLFEPNIVAINSIKEKISKLDVHDIILNEYGLSDITKDDCVYYKNVESFIVNPFTKSVDSGERFSLKKLDDYVNLNNIKKIDFLKTDVEGLDYNVIIGGLETIKTNNIVSYIQIEYCGTLIQYVKLLDNFNFYLMMEPRLLTAINKLNNIDVDFNKSLVMLNDKIINFIDDVVSPTGNGGNIFGVNKNISIDINDLIFNII